MLNVDRVLVLKSERNLELLNRGKIIKTYKIAPGGDPVGAKNSSGRSQDSRRDVYPRFRNAHSHFYKAIHISYPNERDRAAARRGGVSPDGDVYVHGLPNGYGWIGASHRLKDWTDGCIAVTDDEIDEIWAAVRDGTPIEIRP